MNPPNKCRAKDPKKCWKHGNQQGVHTYHVIQKALHNKVSHSFNQELTYSRPLKEMDAPRIATTIIGAAEKLGFNEERMRSCILLAADLHKTDLRQSRKGSSGSQPYIEHPLRNTLRLIRWGVKDEPTLLAGVLHDTVEDHPFEMAEKMGVKTEDEHEARAAAFKYIEQEFGAETRVLVEGMSNPIIENKYTPAAEKNKRYANHVEDAIKNPKVLANKTSDFTDNAVGLYHNRATMNAVGLRKRATKYRPVVDILEAEWKKGIVLGNLPTTQEGAEHAMRQLQLGRERLDKLIEEFSV